MKVADWNSFLLPACPDLRDNESDLNIIWNAVYLATFRGPNEYRYSLISFLLSSLLFSFFTFRNERLAYGSVPPLLRNSGYNVIGCVLCAQTRCACVCERLNDIISRRSEVTRVQVGSALHCIEKKIR